MRSKSVMSAYSHSNRGTDTESYSGNTGKNLESSRLSNARPITAHALARPALTVSDISRVPMSLDDLRNKPVIRAKCLSTMWKNF